MQIILCHCLLPHLITMRSTTAALFLGALAKLISGETHQLIIGTFGTDALYTVEFDDNALTLDLVKTTNTTTASSWLGLSVSELLHIS